MQLRTRPRASSDADSEPRRWIPLVLVLVLLAGLDPLSTSAIEAVARAARDLGADRPDAVPILRAGSYVGTGLLLDRFGPRRVIALGLCLWAATVSVGSGASGPLALTAVHWAMIVTRSALWIAGIVAVGGAVPPGWRALAIAVLFLAGRAWEAGIFDYKLAVFAVEDHDRDAVRRAFLLVAGAAGSLAAALWLALVRGGDATPAAAEPGGLGPGFRRLAALVLVDLCGTIAFGAVERPALSLVRPRLAHTAVAYDALLSWTGIASAAALLGGSAWADAAVRSGGPGWAARRPPILVGLAAAGSLLVLPVVHDPQSLTLLVVAATAGASAAMLTTPALVEASPAGAVGRVLGGAAALGAVVPYFAYRALDALTPAGWGQAPFVVWSGLAALAGAGAAVLGRSPSRRT